MHSHRPSVETLGQGKCPFVTLQGSGDSGLGNSTIRQGLPVLQHFEPLPITGIGHKSLHQVESLMREPFAA